MSDTARAGSETAISCVQGCLVVSLQGCLPEGTLRRVRQDTLEVLHTTGRRALILDMSALSAVDAQAFAHLAATARMARLLGAEAVFVGLQPGVVSFLVDMDIDSDDLQTCRTMEDGIGFLIARRPGEAARGHSVAPRDEMSS